MAHRIHPRHLLSLKLVLLCRQYGVESVVDLPARALALELTQDEARAALDIVRASLATEEGARIVQRFEELLSTPPDAREAQ